MNNLHFFWSERRCNRSEMLEKVIKPAFKHKKQIILKNIKKLT